MTTLATFDVMVRGDTRQFESSMSSAERTGQSFLKTVASMATGFIVADIAMRGLTMAFAAAKDALIGYNARMEASLIGFTTLLGSSEKALVFVDKLKKFAAVTPFDFPGLQTSANLMMGMGFAAQDIIPTLTAVGDLMAAMGRSGSEGSQTIQRIVYNLGQMKQMGRVTNHELRDMVMLGVPIYKILAKGFGVSEAALKDMVAKGVIPADQALKIMIAGIEEGVWGGAMAAQAKTFNGAMSTIKDTVKDLSGAALKPAFDAIRDVVYAFSLLVQAKEAEEFIARVAIKVRGLMIVLQGAAASLMPFVRGLADSASKGWKTFSDFIGGLDEQIIAFAKNTYTGGWNTIVAYAQGMIDAGRSAVQYAIDYITALVGSYLIGGSPPPAGPLANIDSGGQAVIEAWVAGAMSADLSPILNIPTVIASKLKTLESAGKAVEAVIKDIDRQLSVIDLSMSKLQIQADRITFAYQQAVAPLQQAYNILLNTFSLTDKKRSLEFQLARNLLEQQLIAAKGNKSAEAQIQAQIDALDLQSRQNDLLEQQEALQAEIAGIPLAEQMEALTDVYKSAIDPIQAQMDLLQAQRSELEYQRKVWGSIAESIDDAASAMEAAAAALAKSKPRGGGAGKPGIGGGVTPAVIHDVPIPPGFMDDKKNAEEAAKAFADGFLKGIGDTLSSRWPTLLLGVLGGIIGSVIPGLGTAWGAAIGTMIGTVFNDQILGLVAPAQQWINEMLTNIFGGGGLESISFVGVFPSTQEFVDSIRAFVSEGVDWLINTGVPEFAKGIESLTLGLISWVGDAIPVLLNELPKLMGMVLGFITDSGPKLLLALLSWIESFNTWLRVDLPSAINEKLPGVLDAIVKFFGDMGSMLLTELGTLVTNIIDVFDLQEGIDDALEFLGGVGDTIRTGFEDALTWLGDLPGAIGKILDDIVTNITTWVGSIGTTIGDEWSKIVDNVTTWVDDVVTTISDGFVSIVTGVGTWLGGLPGAVADIYTKVITAIGKWADELPGKLFQMGLDAVSSFATSLITIVAVVVSVGVAMVEAFVAWAVALPGKALELGTAVYNNIVSFIGQIPGAIEGFFASIVATFTTFATDSATTATTIGSDFVTGITDFFSQLGPTIAGFLGDVWTNISTFAADVATKAATLGSDILNNIVGFVSKLPGRVVGLLGEVWTSLTTFATDSAAKALEIGSDILTNVSTEIGKIGDAIAQTFDDIVTWLTDEVPRIAGEFGAGAIKMGKAFANGIGGLIEGALNTIVKAINSVQIHFEGFSIDTPAGKVAVAAFDWWGMQLGNITIPRFEQGAWNVPATGPALIHKGEMVIPAGAASKLRGEGGGGLSVESLAVTFNVQSMNASEGEARAFARKMWVYLEDEAFRRGRTLQMSRGG